MLDPEEIEKTLGVSLIGVLPDDDSVFLNGAGFIPSDAKSYRAFKILANNVVGGKVRLYNCVAGYRGFIGYLKRRIKNGL